MDEPSRNERITGRGNRPVTSVSANAAADADAAAARAGSAATCSPSLRIQSPAQPQNDCVSERQEDQEDGWAAASWLSKRGEHSTDDGGSAPDEDVCAVVQQQRVPRLHG